MAKKIKLWWHKKKRQYKCIFYNRNKMLEEKKKDIFGGCYGRRFKNPFIVSKIKDQKLISYCRDCPYYIGNDIIEPEDL